MSNINMLVEAELEDHIQTARKFVGGAVGQSDNNTSGRAAALDSIKKRMGIRLGNDTPSNPQKYDVFKGQEVKR